MKMATDKNRIMISLDDKNLEKLENLVEDARDRRGMRLTKSQVIELLLNTVDYFDDIMGAIYSKKLKSLQIVNWSQMLTEINQITYL